MPTNPITWEPVVECSVAQDYLESQLWDSADYQLVNTEAISTSHEAMPHKYYNNVAIVSVVAHRLSACVCMQSTSACNIQWTILC